MDHLLPMGQDAGDKDCSALAAVLLASLAASNHSPEAQTALVTEIKSALQRALALLESPEKHTRLQVLTALVSTVIESCPSPGQLPQNQVFKTQQNTMNNIVKLLLKKGIVTDLARMPHSLDLSSPNMARTMNSAMKPLETLSRIVNQPQTVQSKAPKSRSSHQAIVDEPATDTAQRGRFQGCGQVSFQSFYIWQLQVVSRTHIKQFTDMLAL